MALRLVRESSQTPNITNKDDTVMTRYAYGGYNGVVKAFGSECGYTAENGVFKVLNGRIVVDGWEIDVDGAGYSFNFSNVVGVQYCSVYAEINVATESVDLKSVYATGGFSEIEKGDDLTTIPNGTARILLYNVKVENGVIVQVIKKCEIIPYLEQIEKNLFSKNNAVAVQKARDFDKSKDENGEFGEIYLRFAQIGLSGYQGTKAVAPLNGYNKDKGTIEDRLTRLGFRSGVIRFAGVDYGSNKNDDTSTNGVFRQGNYVIGNINTQIYFSTSIAINYFADEKTLFVLPEEFRPSKEISFLFIINEVNTEEARFFNVRIDTNGNAIVTVLGTSSAPRFNANYNVKLNFGFESKPIT